MENIKHRYSQKLTAILLALAILFSTVLLAQRVAESAVYRQSALVRLVITQQSVGIGDFVADRKNADMLLKFVGAVTSAYINFELIPVHEAKTFAALFECTNDEITVEKFEYRRKNLVIDGSAASVDAYQDFVDRMRDTQYFDSISGDYYTSTDDSIRFQVICVSAVSDD